MNVSVSDLNKYTFCPRAIYLNKVLEIEAAPTEYQAKGLLGHAIRKEFSLRQSRLIEKTRKEKDVQKLLGEELEKIIRDAPYIYREKLPQGFEKHLSSVKKEVLKELSRMEKTINAMTSQMGYKRALEYATPWKVEYGLKSGPLALTGRIDKIYKRESYTPVEIKTGKPSDYVWEGDLIQAAAYTMMLEEKLGEDIPAAIVEYTRNQSEKPVMNTEKNRRKVIYARDRVIDILEGNDPGVCPHGNPRKCESCALEETCYKT